MDPHKTIPANEIAEADLAGFELEGWVFPILVIPKLLLAEDRQKTEKVL